MKDKREKRSNLSFINDEAMKGKNLLSFRERTRMGRGVLNSIVVVVFGVILGSGISGVGSNPILRASHLDDLLVENQSC